MHFLPCLTGRRPVGLWGAAELYLEISAEISGKVQITARLPGKMPRTKWYSPLIAYREVYKVLIKYFSGQRHFSGKGG
ncbi:MAG: hypothetical protein A3K83_05915 [Omnitrophica WOR_2 bacterium RBG_13_44_8b]|nr:MAG: hypothetical protein A3K83_05915 [Omnitrophica WOR_2 bacterium RBG_13_44_8b]